MRRNSLKYRIVKYCYNHGGWVNGKTIEKLALENNYKASNASRRLRELAEENVLERGETEEGYVRYRVNELPTKLKTDFGAELSQRELRSIVQ